MTRTFARVLFFLLFAAFAASGCRVQRAATAPQNWFEVSGGNWQPSSELLAEIAGAVPDKLASSPRFDKTRPAMVYTIQYQGQLPDGRRLVRLAGACQTDGMSASQLQANFLIVDDGGNCFFDAVYDPELRRFIEFSFHGVA